MLWMYKGTLTRNVMDFRKASIRGVRYGQGRTEIGKASWKLQGKNIPIHILQGEEKAQQNAAPHVSFYCPLYEQHSREFNSVQYQNIREFFRVLSICHDVVPETNELTGTIIPLSLYFD